MSVATSTNIIPPPTTPTSHLQAGNMAAGHVSTSQDLIYTESKSTSDMNPVSMEVVRIPAQILLPMPILEQAAPIDLSKKKQIICSEYEQMGIEEQTTESCEQTTESSALPEICTNSLESGSRCDELNLLATTALSMGLTNRDASNQVGDVTRQKLPFEVSSEIATAKDYSRSKLLRHEPPSSDIEMVHYRDADDESSCEAPASVPPQSDPMDLSKVATDKQNEQPTPAWRNLSPTGPVVVWVQSMSTGIGELPRRTDHSRIRTDANDVTYGSSSQSSTQPSAQSRTCQPGIHLITTPHSHEASFAQQHQHLPGSSREDFVQSPERFHSPSSAAYQIPSDSISLSSSEDGEASTSGYYHGVESMTGVPQGSIPGSPMPGQVKLLHKNFRSPQKGTPLIGDTRRERQRHASKKNRVKNQMMRKALLQDEKHLISSNTKLQGTIRQLESIKSACLGMLATTNLHLTTQLTMHTAKQPVLKPYWDSLGVTIALRVPDPLDMDTNAINIEGALPFKELRCDSKTWPEPMNPHFMSQVLMNVKVDGLEWNGSLLSKGEVTIVTEKGAKTDDDAMLAVDSVVVKKEVTMATEKDDETEEGMLVIDTGSGKEVTMDTV
ncbi:uncharacterized protein [Amphiura filiformis]|uniref:uncharacterized protein n=1 Tax=Amphiura filiformis TaxID=82378 RepID=UPI003B21BB24